jgi:SAM-dependent methyltransferase
LDRVALDEHNRVEDIHWWFLGRRRIILDRLVRLVPPGSGRLVVEIGCATGGNLAAIAKSYRALGIEPDESAAERARTKSGAEVLIGALPEAARLVPPDASAVLCLDVLEHILDDEGALAALAEHLAPSVPLIITVPALPSLFGAHDRALGHHRRYTRSELIDKVEVAGFHVDFAGHFNSLLLPPAWIWRKIRGDYGTGTDLAPVPAPINLVLARVFGAERYLMRYFRLPLGLSLLMEAHTPAPS